MVCALATRYARETGRPVLYSANARVGPLLARLRRLGGEGERPVVNLVGHSWGGPDAVRLAAGAEAQGMQVDNLITLDPVRGPVRRVWGSGLRARWLNVIGQPSQPDVSDRLTDRWPWSRRLTDGFPAADLNVRLDVNHWNVEAMMALSGARERLDESWRGR